MKVVDCLDKVIVGVDRCQVPKVVLPCDDIQYVVENKALLNLVDVFRTQNIVIARGMSYLVPQ